jgi:imidazolonepropionase-like amidohydrolase
MRQVTALFVAGVGLGLCALAHAQDLAVVDATVYTSPEASAQKHTTVLIRHGKITSVGRSVKIPLNTRVLPCGQCVVFAGFWNTHVHFTGPQWTGAAHLPATQLSDQMRAMLTHSGFTTVVDVASDLENTVELRRRIANGEVEGPRIYTAGAALYPPNGVPFYLDDLPKSVLATLPQPATPAAAIRAVQHNQKLGSDVVKLFTGSYASPDRIVKMPIAIARAAVEEGHRHAQLVFAHPSDLEGVRVAIESGVDVLAHAPDTVDGVDDALVKELVNHKTAMTPTLKLFSGSGHIARIREIVARFHALGGVLLFGTDTGFLADYDVAEEYHQLALSGLSFRDVLAMLTTAPASKFKVSSHAGTIRRGADGDLTILATDPAGGELKDFSHVLYTVRAGKVIFGLPASLPLP